MCSNFLETWLWICPWSGYKWHRISWTKLAKNCLKKKEQNQNYWKLSLSLQTCTLASSKLPQVWLSSIHLDNRPILHYFLNFLKRRKIVKILDFHSLIQTCASVTYHLTQILQNISKENPILSLKTIFGRFDNGRQNHAFFKNISCTKFQICWLIFAMFPESWNLLEIFSSEVALSSSLSTYSGDPLLPCCKPQCSWWLF